MKGISVHGGQLAYAFLETLKQEGWQELRLDEGSPRDVRTRSLGLLKVITSHFLRSLVSAKAKRGYAWERYIQHWLVANGDNVHEQDVVAYLRQVFGRPRGRQMLRPGHTHWGA